METEIDGIKLELIRKNIKRMHLYVKWPDGKVVLTVPYNTKNSVVEAFVTSHREWILKNKEHMTKIRPDPNPHFEDGDRVYVLGKEFVLRVVPSNRHYHIELTGTVLTMAAPPKAAAEKRKDCLCQWYRELLSEKLAVLIPKWEQITGLYCSEWGIRRLKAKWGYCATSVRRLCFNLWLAEKPEECIEYVVLHELCHLSTPHHNQDFYALLDKFMPQWKECEKMLKEYPTCM